MKQLSNITINQDDSPTWQWMTSNWDVSVDIQFVCLYLHIFNNVRCNSTQWPEKYKQLTKINMKIQFCKVLNATYVYIQKIPVYMLL